MSDQEVALSRVLLVEDDLLIAMMLEDKLSEFGHCVVGVAAMVASGIVMLRETEPDVAVVEFKLANEECDDLLVELRSRRIPCVVVTAARIDRADARFENIKVVEEPVDLTQLADILDQIRSETVRAREACISASWPRTAYNLVEG